MLFRQTRMETIIATIVILLVIALLFSIAGTSQRQCESQERLERHAISQLPDPEGFSDCSHEVVLKVRNNEELKAIHLHWTENGRGDIDASKLRIKELRAFLMRGSEFGRPKKGLFE